MFRTALLSTAVLAAADTVLVSFDGAEDSTQAFESLNDPVMGGKSTGSWAVNATGQFGIFDGQVVEVPSLKAPGFIKISAAGDYADISSLDGGELVLKVRSRTPEYKGFRVAFASGTISPKYSCAGGGSLPFSRGCFKSQFNVPETTDGEWAEVRLPFSSFTDKWSPATGEPTKTCPDDPSTCITKDALGGIRSMEVWAEGVAGKIHLEIDSIRAASKALRSGASIRPPAAQDHCKAAVQDKLKFDMSGRDSPLGLFVAVDPNESLAEAVCCDDRALPVAEPQFLYAAPDIMLYSKMEAENDVTVFYDSVCGLPLFQTPVNRTLDDFKADTDEHGWPSFRTAEIFFDNVLTDKTTGYVTSSCGTHLGSYLPDEEGPRWCIDLACVSGNKA